MIWRKGEITLPAIKRHWPHHVALLADKVRGVVNSNIVWSFAETLSAAPRPYPLRRDDEFVVSTLQSRKTRRCSPSGSVGSDYQGGAITRGPASWPLCVNTLRCRPSRLLFNSQRPDSSFDPTQMSSVRFVGVAR
jgi:hypothetical protein